MKVSLSAWKYYSKNNKSKGGNSYAKSVNHQKSVVLSGLCNTIYARPLAPNDKASGRALFFRENSSKNRIDAINSA